MAAFATGGVDCLADPATHDVFLHEVKDSIAVAKRLNGESLIVVSGAALPNVERSVQRSAVVAALRAASSMAEDAGITLIVEPLNTALDHPGVFLDRAQEGLSIIAEVSSPAVKLLWDVYHSAMMDEPFSAILNPASGPLIGHVHFADAPGRQEPGTGSIDWMGLLSDLRRVGYAGPIGLEYRPSLAGSNASLARSFALLREASKGSVG